MLDVERQSLTRRLTEPALDPAKGVQRPTPAVGTPLQRTLAPKPIPTQPAPVTTQPAPSTALSVQRPGMGASAAPSPMMATRPTPALNRTLADTWKPTLNSGTGASGEPVYDNASLQRMATRPQIARTLETPAQPHAPRPEPGGIQRSLVTRPLSTVASTFGQPINAMQNNFTEPAVVRRPDVAFRGPDAMGEHYRSLEDRDARRKLASDLDSQRFRLELIAGNPGRRGRAALEALGQNAEQQAALAAGGEKLSAEAIQGRAGREATLANTGLEQAGQDRRAEFGAAAGEADRAQQLGIARMQDATKRFEIDAGAAKGETITSADGTVYRVAGDGTARTVTDAQGNPLRAPVARDAGALTPAQRLESINRELSTATEQLTAMTGLHGTAPPEQVKAQQDYVTSLQEQLQTTRGGTGATGDAGAQARQKPSWEQFQARAKAQGSRLTPEQLKAYFDQMQ